MSLCASCGLEIIDGSELCRHHVPLADDWAQSNRIMCDFFHRRRVPACLVAEGAGDEPWVDADAA
jgi:hypothetical protein